MNEIIGKLTNLTYEIFGVILPGMVAALFLAAWWAALGPVAPLWSLGGIQALTVRDLIEFFSTRISAGMVIPLLAVSYFLGHLVLWVARAGVASEDASRRPWKRIKRSLFFRIPKPSGSYDPSLDSLFEAIRPKFALGGQRLEWRQFYPVAKSYIAQRLTYSLIATYQNKYTLHRSLTTGAAGLFWLSVLGLVGGLVTLHFKGVEPNWFGLGSLLAFSILVIWGFSGSYMYHWQMFGNTIITESYSLIAGPADEHNRSK